MVCQSNDTGGRLDRAADNQLTGLPWKPEGFGQGHRSGLRRKVDKSGGFGVQFPQEIRGVVLVCIPDEPFPDS